MVVHPARGNWNGTLVNALLHHCGESILSVGDIRRPGIVHRLDKDTSGLMVAAKTDRAVVSLADQFERRTAGRTYRAVVKGCPDRRSEFAGYGGISFEKGGILRIEGDIGRHPTNPIKRAVVEFGGRFAVTRVRLVELLASGAASLVECRLETGRTHQIRVHMEKVGHPLIGDPAYGSAARSLPASAGEKARAAAASFERQALHATMLNFEHPSTGEAMTFESELPADIAELKGALL